jgi:hypothetical protein
MVNLCTYKDIFGKPNTNAHSFRIFDIAIVDVIVTVIIGLLLSNIFKTNLTNTLIFLFILGIIVHRLFCVRTTIDKLLFD